MARRLRVSLECRDKQFCLYRAAVPAPVLAAAIATVLSSDREAARRLPRASRNFTEFLKFHLPRCSPSHSCWHLTLVALSQCLASSIRCVSPNLYELMACGDGVWFSTASGLARILGRMSCEHKQQSVVARALSVKGDEPSPESTGVRSS
jgi:hypothetical protein